MSADLRRSRLCHFFILFALDILPASHTMAAWRWLYRSAMKAATMQTRLPMEIVDREMARVLARKTEAERLEIGWGMQRSAVRMMTRIIRGERPDWTDAQIGREVARRISHGG